MAQIVNKIYEWMESIVNNALMPNSVMNAFGRPVIGFAKGKCRACVNRSPAGAISEAGHDKTKCKEYIRQVTALYVEPEQLGFKVNSCGLCQTKVPCDSINPTLRKLVR